MKIHRSVASITVSAGMATLMVFAFLPAFAAASPSVNSGAPPVGSWAYGHVESVTVHPMYTATGWEYEGSFSIGFSVIINETNQTAGPDTFGLAVYEAEGVALSLEFCKPDCGAPQQFANLSLHAWEKTNDWANFTTNGSVMENGQPTTALGILNANSQVRANLTETTFSALRLTASGPAVDRSKYLSAALASDASVAFSPELGLIPLNLLSLNPSNATWTSTSNFTASGSVRSTYYFAFHGPVITNLTVGPTSTTENFAPNGSVSVVGSFASPNGVAFGSIGAFPAIRLVVAGPFTIREGIILVPEAADLLGTLTEPWSSNQASAATVAISSFDFKPYYDGHLGLIASARTFTLSSENPANVTGQTENSTGELADVATPMSSNPVTSTTLQGEPETVGSAQTSSQCLLTGICPSSSASHILFAVAIAGVVVIGAVGLISVVVIADRRRIPSSSNPNARLYPPVAFPPAVGARQAGPGAPTKPATEEDPLDNLW